MTELKLYIIAYIPLARGGIGNPIQLKLPETTLVFSDESDMLNRVAELKKDSCVENIKIYVSKYSLTSCEEYKI